MGKHFTFRQRKDLHCDVLVVAELRFQECALTKIQILTEETKVCCTLPVLIMLQVHRIFYFICKPKHMGPVHCVP